MRDSDLLRRTAEALRSPLLCDASGLVYRLVADDQTVTAIDTCDHESGSDSCLLVQTSGIGIHCRWALTNKAMIVLFNDGTYWAKELPPGLLREGSDAYRSTFSFYAAEEDADVIVVCCTEEVFLLRVRNQVIEDETLRVAARCYCGYALGRNEYVLYGQTPRVAVQEPGLPLRIDIASTGFQARVLRFGYPGILESIVAHTLIDGRRWLVVGEYPKGFRMEDYDDGLLPPGASDHIAFVLIPEDALDEYQRIGSPRFICAAGAPDAGVFFQENGLRSQQEMAELLRLGGNLAEERIIVQGLAKRSSIHRIEFDPAIGWFGIAELHNAERNRYLLRSSDGNRWFATPMS